PPERVSFRGRDTPGARALHRTPRRRGAAHGRQRAPPGRGGAAKEPAGQERRLLQPAGCEASATGECGGADPRRAVNREGEGLIPPFACKLSSHAQNFNLLRADPALLASWLGLIPFDPERAVRGVLLLPDRHAFLEPVDPPPAGVDRLP